MGFVSGNGCGGYVFCVCFTVTVRMKVLPTFHTAFSLRDVLAVESRGPRRRAVPLLRVRAPAAEARAVCDGLAVYC